MADKKLPPDHPQTRPKRKRPTRKPLSRPILRENSDAPLTLRPPAPPPRTTSGRYDTGYAGPPTATPCHDPQYTGPERRGLDPFWMHLAADLYLARRTFAHWLRTKMADGIAWLAVKLMRVADKVGPNA